MKRAAIFAAATSLVGLVGAFVLPGAANAQSGSRLCGVEWVAEAQFDVTPKVPEERLIKIYEVGKHISECDLALDRGRSDRTPMDAPADLKTKMLHKKNNDYWESDRLYVEQKCDTFTEKVLGNDFKLVGTNFPASTPHTDDICLDMNRSDTFAEMEAYWLFGTPVLDRNGVPVMEGDHHTPKMQWFLQRG